MHEDYALRREIKSASTWLRWDDLKIGNHELAFSLHHACIGGVKMAAFSDLSRGNMKAIPAPPMLHLLLVFIAFA